MIVSSFERIDRRRLVVSSVLGGAAVLTTAQAVLAAPAASASVVPLAQDNSSGVPMFRGDPGRTGVMPGPGPDSTQGVEASLVSKPEYSVSSTSPAVVNGVIYVGDDEWGGSGSNFYAIDAVTGIEQWRFPAGEAISCSPAVVDGAVFFGSDDGNLYALDATAGTVRWKFTVEFGGVRSSPAVVGGVVYFGSADRNLYALSAADGSEFWRSTLDLNSYGEAIGISSAPAVVDGIVCFRSDDSSLYAVNAEDGTELWRAGLVLDEWMIETPPVVANGGVYVVRADDALHALDLQTGAELWKFDPADGHLDDRAPAVADGVIYAFGSGYLFAVDVASGMERWRLEVLKDIYDDVAFLVVADNVVYVAGEVNLYAIDIGSRTELWRSSRQITCTDAFCADSYVVCPAVTGGVVYINGSDGALYAIGSGVAKLQVGGAARVTEATSLRGGPSSTAVEREQLEPDTIVTITDEFKMTGDVSWWPVSVAETGNQGWVDASKLEPLLSEP